MICNFEPKNDSTKYVRCMTFYSASISLHFRDFLQFCKVFCKSHKFAFKIWRWIWYRKPLLVAPNPSLLFVLAVFSLSSSTNLTFGTGFWSWMSFFPSRKRTVQALGSFTFMARDWQVSWYVISHYCSGKWIKMTNFNAASVGVSQDNLVLSTGLIMWIGHRKQIRKLTFRALALRRSIHFLLAPAEGLFFKPKYRANILKLS